METATLEELRLGSFKSFRSAQVPLTELTLLIGRNGTGKSNVLDALDVLARLASGDDLRGALEDDRGGSGQVRGGVDGLPPSGGTRFGLGCTVSSGEDRFTLDVEIETVPQVQVVHEELCGPTTRYRRRTLLESLPPDPQSADISAKWWNGKRGRNPSIAFRASRLLTSQVASRVPTTTKSGQAVHRAAEVVLAALQGIFHLDPVPHLMRHYVQERDIVLRRTGENLSAVVRHLAEVDPSASQELFDLFAMLPESTVRSLETERSSLGDVMLAMREHQDGTDILVPARLMSDGLLRYLAIASALLSASQPEVRSRTKADADAGRTLVIEELENGLHPSQAANVLHLLVREGRRRRVRTIATTHSPALLTALDGAAHDDVLVCDRDPQRGLSRLRRLSELHGYPAAMAAGTLGEAMTRGLLAGDRERRREDLEAFQQLLGIG
jgi:predicted ATPase